MVMVFAILNVVLFTHMGCRIIHMCLFHDPCEYWQENVPGSDEAATRCLLKAQHSPGEAF